MKKILFVTNRNVLTTSGELRLIKNRAESLYKDYNVVTDFIVIQSKKRISSPQRECIETAGEFETVELSFKRFFFSIFHTIKILRNLSKKNHYDAVMFSGVGMLFFSLFVSKRMNVFCDIHGASEDAIEVVKKAPIAKKIFFRFIYFLDVFCLRLNSSRVDAFFVVTEALEKYLLSRYRMKKDVKFIRVPCATQGNLALQENYEMYRFQYRNKYNIKSDEVVFIYSGGVSSWQCIPQTILLYKKLQKKLKCKTKLLIFSHQKDFFHAFCYDDDSIVIDSYGPDELLKALFAGDFAIMLRENCVTNNVAFPNKFLEYVQSRMKIISTPFVYEVAEQIKNNNIGFIYDFSENLDELSRYIESSKCNDLCNVQKVLDYNSFKSRLFDVREIL